MPERQATWALRANFSVEQAAFRTARYRGNFQGAALGLLWEWRRWALRAVMPVYRLNRNGLRQSGLGDALLQGRVTLFDLADRHAFGAVFGTSLPSGSAARQLGMGHPMVMPAIWWAYGDGRLRIAVQLGYGAALRQSGGAHEHGGAPRPLVNPMNASEIDGQAQFLVWIAGPVGLSGGMYGAQPVGMPGQARWISRAGLHLRGDYYALGAEVHAPVVGDPFLVKGVVTATLEF